MPRRIDLVERISHALRRSRDDAGVSQSSMAKALGVSKATIQNWESGISCPNLIQSLEWFGALDLQPLPYYLQTLFPERCSLTHESADEDVLDALLTVIKALPASAQRKLYYLLSGDHGSSPLAMLEMITAHLQAPLRDRLNIAQGVALNYEIAGAYHNIARADRVQPDMRLLYYAIGKGKDAVMAGKNTYTAYIEEGGEEL